MGSGRVLGALVWYLIWSIASGGFLYLIFFEWKKRSYPHPYTHKVGGQPAEGGGNIRPGYEDLQAVYWKNIKEIMRVLCG